MIGLSPKPGTRDPDLLYSVTTITGYRGAGTYSGADVTTPSVLMVQKGLRPTESRVLMAGPTWASVAPDGSGVARFESLPAAGGARTDLTVSWHCSRS